MSKTPTVTDIALIKKDIEYIKLQNNTLDRKIDHIDTQVSANYVTKQEFDPVKRLVYGVVSLIMIGVVGAILSMVFRQ